VGDRTLPGRALRHLHDPQSGGSNEVELRLPGGGLLKANGTVVVEPLGLDGTLVLENNSLTSSWRAVEHLFEFDLTSGTIDFDLDYQVGLEEDGPHLVVDGADVRITDYGLRWEDHEIDLLQVDGINVSGGHLEWPEQKVAADSIIITGATAFGWIGPDGTPSWDVLIPEESQEQIAATRQTLEERLQIQAQVGRFELRNSGAEFEDQTFSPPIRFKAHEVNLVVTDISTKHGSTWPFEGSGTFAESARARPRERSAPRRWRSRPRWASRIWSSASTSPTSQARAGQPQGRRAASLGHRPRVPAESDAALQASYQGGFEVTGLDLDETITGDKLIGWGDLKVDGIDARLEPMSADVREVDIDNAGLEITVAENGTINLLEFMNAMGEGEEAASGAGLPPVHIARTRLNDCYGIYTDKTVSGPFRMALTRSTAHHRHHHRLFGSAVLDIDAEIESGGWSGSRAASTPSTTSVSPTSASTCATCSCRR